MAEPSNDKSKRPLRIAYDILRMTAGGGNGGIKTHHYEFLRQFAEHHQKDLQLLVFCQSEVVEELKFLSANPLNQIHVHGTRTDFEFRDSDGKNPTLHFWPEIPDNLLKKLGVDVLYAGFGFSDLYSPDIPQVSLIVDVLHRAYPESLPTEEVAFRDKWYTEELQKSTLVQTNSEYCKQQLVDEFGADPDKIFVIGVPVHGRFNRVEMGQLPDRLRGHEHKYFLYPANYWPHKNHKRLIEAYALYEKEAGDEALHLVLTGSREGLFETVEKQIMVAGLSSKVHQIGHLDMPTYKAVWELSHSLVFPSLYEGFGIPILEAAFFQKPIAASDCFCLSHVVPSSALRLESEEKTAFSSNLSRLHKEPHRFLDFSKIPARFSLLQVAGAWVQGIQRSASQRHTPFATVV